jgi:hypothetical protein
VPPFRAAQIVGARFAKNGTLVWPPSSNHPRRSVDRKAGKIEVIRPSALDEILVAIVRPAQFTGDISMILGRPAQMRLRVRDSGEVVQLTGEQMHALISAQHSTPETGALHSGCLREALSVRTQSLVTLSGQQV